MWFFLKRSCVFAGPRDLWIWVWGLGFRFEDSTYIRRLFGERAVCLQGLAICGHGVATIKRLFKIIVLFCRIQSLLQGFFAKETYNLKEPTNRSHPVASIVRVFWQTCVAVCCSVNTDCVCVCVCVGVCLCL